MNAVTKVGYVRASPVDVFNLRVGILDVVEARQGGVSNKDLARKYPRVGQVTIKKAVRQLRDEGLIKVVDLGRGQYNGLRYYPAVKKA